MPKYKQREMEDPSASLTLATRSLHTRALSFSATADTRAPALQLLQPAVDASAVYTLNMSLSKVQFAILHTSHAGPMASAPLDAVRIRSIDCRPRSLTVRRPTPQAFGRYRRHDRDCRHLLLDRARVGLGGDEVAISKPSHFSSSASTSARSAEQAHRHLATGILSTQAIEVPVCGSEF